MKKIFIRAACLLLALLLLCGFSLLPQSDPAFAAVCQSEETVQTVLNSGIRGMIHEHEWVYIKTFPSVHMTGEEGEAVVAKEWIPCVICNYCHENLTLNGMRKDADIEAHLNTHDRVKTNETQIRFYYDLIEYRYVPDEDEIHDYYECAICKIVKAE